MTESQGFPVEMGFSPQAFRVMKRAEAEAVRFGQRAICSEHLLSALLTEQFGPAVQAVDAYGDREAIVREIEGVLSTPTIKGDQETKARLLAEWEVERSRRAGGA
jgi:ATP-dependent Clp protease ATP-binding subunit ClpA